MTTNSLRRSGNRVKSRWYVEKFPKPKTLSLQNCFIKFYNKKFSPTMWQIYSEITFDLRTVGVFPFAGYG